MFKRILQIAIVAVVAGYVYWPYHASSKFFDNFNAPVPAAIDKFVDMDAVNAAEKGLFNEVADHVLDKLDKPRTKDLDLKIDAAANRSSSSMQDILVWGMEMKRRKPEVRVENRKWTSPREMTVRVKGDYCGRLWKFRFVSLSGWKFVGWEMDPEYKSRLLTSVANEAQAQVEQQQRMQRLQQQQMARQRRR